jgi:hypothetical protein
LLASGVVIAGLKSRGNGERKKIRPRAIGAFLPSDNNLSDLGEARAAKVSLNPCSPRLLPA